MRQPISSETALVVFFCASVAYLFLAFLMLRLRTLEVKMLGLGLATALLAVWCGLAGLESGVQVRGPGGQEAMASISAGSEATRAMGRIAVLLILGGVAVSVLNTWSASAPRSPEEVTRDRPV